MEGDLMLRTQQPRHRLGWVVLVALCLSSLLAGPAWADGEDDPAFAGTGTAFVPFEGRTLTAPPVTDQAPDGSVAGAAIVRDEVEGRLAFGSEAVWFGRFGAGGTLVHQEVSGQLMDLTEVFDVEHVDGGTQVVLGAREPVETDDRVVADSEEDVLLTLFYDASDALVDQFSISAPPGCGSSVSGRSRRGPEPAGGVPTAAEIALDGQVYAVWDCQDGEPTLTRTSPADGDFIGLGTDGRPVEITLGPAGDAFVAIEGEYQEDEPRRNFSQGGTLVVRVDGDLEVDDAYGNDASAGAILPGEPYDLAVDGSGRAVVWTSSGQLDRGIGEAWSLYRLDGAGDLDPGFGGDGEVILQDVRFGDLVDCRAETTTYNCPAHLITQADGKVVLVGLGNAPQVRGARQPSYVIVRLLVDGTLDPAWGEGGVRGLDIDTQPEDAFAGLFYVGEPGLQSDGKLLVPYGAYSEPIKERRVPAPPEDDESFGMTRIGLSAAPATPQQQSQQQPSGAAKPPATSPTVAAATSKAAKSCQSRRSFTIRLRTGRTKAEQSPIVSAVVRVNGKKVKVSKGARQTSKVVLTQLPKGRFTVSIRLRLKDGGTVTDNRRYRTCAKKVERELAPLRTHPPR
jgi:hypothetical protein